MLPGLKVVEQRHPAVLEVLEGATVGSVAHRSQVARRTVPVWLGRDAAYGRAGLAGKSSRPLSGPYQIRPEVEARIVAIRREHPGGGPGTVRYWLDLEGLPQLPGRTRVERCPARHQTGA
jgi:hypothetical protein